MEASTQTRLRPTIWHVFAVFLVLGGAFVLFYFNPAQNGFYPRCLFKATTGFDCPGCGGLRAAHQLLHGNVGAAFTLNPLLILLIPVAALLWANMMAKRLRGRPLFRMKVPAYFVWLLLAAAIAFTILRNWPSTALS